MKKITIILVLGLLTKIGNAQTFQWAKQIAGTAATAFNVNVKDITSRNGEVYVCGTFTGTVDFDPSTTVNNKIANGTDGFVARFDADGDLVWVTTSNLAGNEDYLKIRMGTDGFTGVDNFVNVLIKIGTSSFNITAHDNNTGASLFNTANYSSTGTVQPNDFQSFNGIYYLVGNYTGTLTIGANVLTSEGGSDAFIVAFNITNTPNTFTLFDANSFGGTGEDVLYDVTFAPLNLRVFAGGSFTGTFNGQYANNTNFSKTSAGLKDGIVMEIDPTTLKPIAAANVHTFGGIGDDEVLEVEGSSNSTTGINYLYLGGYFSGTVDFDLSGNTSNLISAGGTDAFIVNYQVSGNNFNWLFDNSYGGASDDRVSALSRGNSTFGGIAYTIQRANTFGGNFIELGGLASNGTAFPFGGTMTATAATTLFRANNIFFVGNGDIYTVGTFNGTADLNPDSVATNNLTFINGGSGSTNGFIQKLADCATSIPAAAPTIAGTSTVCAGTSITLTATGSLNNSGKWVWYSGSCGGTLLGEGNTITVTPTTTTNYYVRGEGGCVPNGSCSNFFGVLVNPLPSTIVTQLNSTTLSVSEINGSATYQWINCATNANIPGATNQTFSPTQAGDYKVRVTLNGCTATSACTSFCLVASQPSITGANVVCSGQSVTLSVGLGSLNNNTTWRWYSGSCGGTVVGTGTSISVSPTVATTYYVRGEGGCTNDGVCSLGRQVSPIAIPNNGVTLTGSTLTATASGNGFNFQWIDCNNNNANIAGATNQSFTPTVSGNYAVKITTVVGGCQVTSACTQVTLCVPASTPTITGNNEVCSGFGSFPSIASGSLNGNTTWRWYSGSCGGTLVGTGTSIAVSPTTTTDYYVRGEGGCSTNGNCSAVFTVIVNPSPNNAVTSSGNTLTATQVGATYQWLDCNNGNAIIAGATSQSFTPTVSGSYSVRVFSSFGCVATSSCTQVNILNIDEFSKLGLTFYPNPAHDYFVIESEIEIEKIDIYNLLGQKIKVFTLPESKYAIDELSSGTYIIEVTTVNGIAKTKLIKE